MAQAVCKLCGTYFQFAEWQTKWRASACSLPRRRPISNILESIVYCFDPCHDAYLSGIGDWGETEGWPFNSTAQNQDLPFPEGHLKRLVLMRREITFGQMLHLLHEKCWVILRHYINAEELDLKRLFHTLSITSYGYHIYPLDYSYLSTVVHVIFSRDIDANHLWAQSKRNVVLVTRPRT